jgi:hypothetical protein
VGRGVAARPGVAGAVGEREASALLDARAARTHERAVASPPGARVASHALALCGRRAAAPLGERLRQGERPGDRDEDEQ